MHLIEVILSWKFNKNFRQYITKVLAWAYSNLFPEDDCWEVGNWSSGDISFFRSNLYKICEREIIILLPVIYQKQNDICLINVLLLFVTSNNFIYIYSCSRFNILKTVYGILMKFEMYMCEHNWYLVFAIFIAIFSLIA